MSCSGNRLYRSSVRGAKHTDLRVPMVFVGLVNKYLARRRIPGTVYCVQYITPPWADFHGRYLHSWNGVGAEKVCVGDISRRALRRRIFRCLHPLGCRAIELEKKNTPQGGVIDTVL